MLVTCQGTARSRAHVRMCMRMMCRAEAPGREPCADLNKPSFNNCTVPIIWYPWFPFNIGEVIWDCPLRHCAVCAHACACCPMCGFKATVAAPQRAL